MIAKCVAEKDKEKYLVCARCAWVEFDDIGNIGILSFGTLK